MRDSEYVSRGKSAVGTDDSSSELGLDHSYAKGRPVVTLPEQRPEPDPKMVGLSPDEFVEYLDRQEDERGSNNIEQLMKEVPGGKTPGSHSSSSGKRRTKPGSGGGISGQNVPFDGKDVSRPHVLSGRVSHRAKHGIDRQHESAGDMLNVLGEALDDGVSWAQIEYTLRDLADRKRLAAQA